jgi:adenosylhomocysteine nucleosidase
MSEGASRPVGILCAMREEAAELAHRIAGTRARAAAGVNCRAGRFNGLPVVMAEGGIGKVGASMLASVLVERFECRALLVCGVAGGVDPALGIGDVVIADRLVQHDYGAVAGLTLRNFRPGVPPLGNGRSNIDYPLAPALRRRLARAVAGLALAPMPAAVAGGRVPSLRFGTIVTGDQFVNCDATRRRLQDRFSAQAVDMESAAVAQVAEAFRMPWVAVRSLSDLAGSESHLEFGAFIAAAARNSAAVIDRVLPALVG